MKYLLAAYSLGIAFICIWVPFCIYWKDRDIFVGYGFMFSGPWNTHAGWSVPFSVDWSRMSLRFIAWTAICFAVYAIKFIGKQSAKPEVSKMKAIASLLLVAAFSISAAGKDVRAPLPDKLLTAKTTFIDNQSGYAEAADHCFAALREWGKYKVVSSQKDAELIFVLTSGNRHVSGNGVIIGTNVVDTSSDLSLTTLTVVDPSNNQTLWSDTKSARRGSRAGSLVKELRERLEAKN